MQRRTLISCLAFFLTLALMAPLLLVPVLATGEQPFVSDAGTSSVTIHLPGKPDSNLDWTADPDTPVFVMTRYFSAGQHSFSINCSTAYNVEVYLTYDGAYWSGKTLTSSSPGPWTPLISIAGYYSVWVYNNSNSSVDITLNIS